MHAHNKRIGQLVVSQNKMASEFGRVRPRHSEFLKMSQFYKTKTCPWYSLGKCRMGDQCNWSHHRGEIRPSVDLAKTKLCAEFAKGLRCVHPNCRYAHSYCELRATSDVFKTILCVYWTKGHCVAGVNCRYAHGEKELRQRAAPSQRLPAPHYILPASSPKSFRPIDSPALTVVSLVPSQCCSRATTPPPVDSTTPSSSLCSAWSPVSQESRSLSGECSGTLACSPSVASEDYVDDLSTPRQTTCKATSQYGSASWFSNWSPDQLSLPPENCQHPFSRGSASCPNQTRKQPRDRRQEQVAKDTVPAVSHPPAVCKEGEEPLLSTPWLYDNRCRSTPAAEELMARRDDACLPVRGNYAASFNDSTTELTTMETESFFSDDSQRSQQLDNPPPSAQFRRSQQRPQADAGKEEEYLWGVLEDYVRSMVEDLHLLEKE